MITTKFWFQICHKSFKLINIWPRYGLFNVGYLISKSTYLYINLSLNISLNRNLLNQNLKSNIIKVSIIFVKIWCKKEEFRNLYFKLSIFFVQNDQGWQGKGSLTLYENVRFPVEAGRGQVSTSSPPLVSDRKLHVELLGHGFHGRLLKICICMVFWFLILVS